MKPPFSNLVAKFSFFADYHSGQTSLGYKLLCRTKREIKRYYGKQGVARAGEIDLQGLANNKVHQAWIDAYELYQYLANKYGDRV